MAARNVPFAWFASSASAWASCASANRRAFSIATAACWDRPVKEVEVRRAEDRARDRPPDGHHADDPPTGEQRCRHQSLRYVRGVPAMWMARGIGLHVVDHLGRAAGGHVADDPLAEDRSDRPGPARRCRRCAETTRRSGRRPRRRKTAVVPPRAARAPARRCAAGRRSGRASPRSRDRPRPGRPSRSRGAGTRRRAVAFWIAAPMFAASVVSRRTSASPKRPASVVLWTLIAPIASSPTMIGTPRYETARRADAVR